MKNPVKEVKEKLLEWGRARLIALHSVYRGADPVFNKPYPDPFEADEETISAYGYSDAVDVWYDMIPGELHLRINFNKINSTKDLKTYILSEIENYLDEHPEYRKRKRVKLDEVIEVLQANEYTIAAPWPERLRELWSKPEKSAEEFEEFQKLLFAHRASTWKTGPKQTAKFLFPKWDENNIDSCRKRVQRLLAKFDDEFEPEPYERPFKKLTYP
jgi:hypothetical protein